MISLFIKGIPVPQGRPRARLAGKRVIMYDPQKSREWKNEVKRQCVEHGVKIMEGALRMSLTFYLLRPKSLPKSVEYHIKRPDVDNLAKAIKDAMEGVFYKNDSQVCTLRIDKKYCEEHPGVQVEIESKELPF